MNEIKNQEIPACDYESKSESSTPFHTCQTSVAFKSALTSSQQTKRILKRLRRSILDCELCTVFRQCELREIFISRIDSVVAGINDEWGW